MTDSTELKMNVAALKRVDPYIKDILGTATHVALYTFNPDNNEWEKTDIEGALFVYSRNGEPYNSILIMNRLNTKNLVEPVTQGLELQLQEPFLLYRNSKCNIYGIWFYDKEECIKIATLLNKLAEDSEDSSRKSLTNSGAKGKKVAAASAVAAKSGDNVDIFSMLSKAQEDFNTNKNCKKESEAGSEGSMPAAPTAPMGLDVTSQSVMDFFAKAKVNTGHFKAGDQPSPSAHPVSETKPLLARLMSHPAAHTLEHIEKQQRSITPQPLQQSGGMGSLAHSASMPTPNSASRSTPASKSKKQQNSTKMTPQHDSVVSTLNSVSQELQRQTKSTGNSNGTMNFHRIQSPTNTTSGSKHGIFSIGGQPLTTAHDDSIGTATLPDAMSALPMSFANLGMDCKSTEGTPTRPIPASAPALIPPTMFSAPSPSEPTNRPLEPLTGNQLLQAFNYLLKNDPDFINKLHEAYVKSFSEILS